MACAGLLMGVESEDNNDFKSFRNFFSGKNRNRSGVVCTRSGPFKKNSFFVPNEKECFRRERRKLKTKKLKLGPVRLV